MSGNSQQKIKRVTIIYWLLLFYIVAALAWWFISLENQNRQIQHLKEELSILQQQKSGQDKNQILATIKAEGDRNNAKYLGEGVAFLILIMVGAFFVFRSVRRQFNLQQQQQNFMMAVTHELKTPISVARLNLETLKKYTLDPEKQKKLILNALDETARLNFLTNNILIASQLEGGRYESSKEELDLSRLLKDCIQDFRNRFPDRKFLDEIEPDADIKGDPLLLQILINNLIENAIKYSPKDARVTAFLRKYRSGIELQIRDEGPGIPDEEKKKIFSRFYRIGNEATRKKQGTGLGLYLCSIIAKDHNADISVTNNEPTGSNFAVIFKT
ncbi:MAG: two-component sensor histidine kinase [Chitinophagaceae bacterium]|nr:two-component sensor histidine kinase [Chitinophagaceae bacterium]MBP6590771.1 two-component sensor histidine kinase [Chitinophagaceae bacterium]MBP8243567.1 two-component sensor histidine kinase [Chitinophagaceae bacterium]